MPELLARRVLSDCRWALSQYSPELSGEPLRVGWVAIVTLLRAVGHVLFKIDAAQDPSVSRVVESRWKDLKATQPEPRIYWQFIESERNSVLKQYAFGFSRSFQVSISPPGPVRVELRGDMLSLSGGQLPAQDLPDLKSLIVEGPFQGCDEKEVAYQAIEWWELKLTEIERTVFAESLPEADCDS